MCIILKSWGQSIGYLARMITLRKLYIVRSMQEYILGEYWSDNEEVDVF